MIWDLILTTPTVIIAARQKACVHNVGRRSPQSLIPGLSPGPHISVAALRQVCTRSRLRAKNFQTSFVDGGHIYGNGNVDILWLNFPLWQGQYWRESGYGIDDFPIWDGPIVSHVAVAAAGIHSGVRSVCPLLELGEVLYGLYTHGTSKLYLVVNDYDHWVHRSRGHHIVFRDPDQNRKRPVWESFRGKNFRDFLEGLDSCPTVHFSEKTRKYIRGVSRRPLRELNWTGLGNCLLLWLNNALKDFAEREIPRKGDGTLDLDYRPSRYQHEHYSMLCDWAAGKWRLTRVAYVEAVTY